MYSNTIQNTPANINLSFYSPFLPTEMLVFRYKRAIFAVQNCADMRTIESIYSDFAQMLLADRIYEDDTITYADICASLGVSPARLDDLLYEELGMDGPEVLYSFQKVVKFAGYN